jgi:hypothetical protein
MPLRPSVWEPSRTADRGTLFELAMYLRPSVWQPLISPMFVIGLSEIIVVGLSAVVVVGLSATAVVGMIV